MHDAELSKTVSHALRHAPWVYELELDAEGWTPIDALLASLRMERSRWREMQVADLQAMIDSSAKVRFEIAGDRIRAIYGHSVPGRLLREPATPPDVLYHGTSPDVVETILRDGLMPMRRQFVHMSIDEPTALEVGRRKAAKPALLRIDASSAHREGVTFYAGNDLVWLADIVPGKYIARARE